jgi:UDP-2-acetamido-2,6-beta-L-arabino-hexul-4-ose reductase
VRILVTGANGFVGKNLLVHLSRRADVETLLITRESTSEDLDRAANQADMVFHLAGVNRPENVDEFASGNVDSTRRLCLALNSTSRKIPIVYTSSIQAECDNPYGVSKRRAEKILLDHGAASSSPIYLYRLPNVFGKWCRPNYNSAVATFCHNIARGLPIQINDPLAQISLVYIDDLISSFSEVIDGCVQVDAYRIVTPSYGITVGELARQIRAFKDSRMSLLTEAVGSGLTRALYSTYVSYLPTEQFAYNVPKYGDARGVFVEMLKTHDSGQFSYFTAHPGITRGIHYHHSKTEKFLVIKGKARFGFRHIVTGERFALTTSGDTPQIVETVPGWSHDITNIGDDEMIVMLWANEIFDRDRPDTYSHPV